jgi:hypothetical protein
MERIHRLWILHDLKGIHVTAIALAFVTAIEVAYFSGRRIFEWLM